jgi:hypothetical protein
MKKITVTMTWEQLAAMEDNGLALYATPGAAKPYWAAQPSFKDDTRLATAGDFEYCGIPYCREDECDEVFSVEVELSAAAGFDALQKGRLRGPETLRIRPQV